MKKITAFILLFSVVALTVSAQKKLYLSQHPVYEEWVDTPIAHDVPPEYIGQPAFYLLSDKKIDYRYEGGYITGQFTYHAIIKVLDDAGIEKFSTVYIPIHNGNRVPIVKARTISPKGEVRNIAKNMVKIEVDEDGDYVLEIAMEGVEKNSEIEYLVKELTRNTSFGRTYFQSSIPVATTRFCITYPKDLVIETKSYNDFPVLKPELINNRHQLKTEVKDIPSLYSEKLSFYNLHRMAMEYRVSYILDENKEKIKFNNWNKFARTQYDKYYSLSEKEKAAVNKFLSEIGVHANGDEVENITKIEQAIKKNFVLYPYVRYDEDKQTIATYEMRSMSLYAAGYDAPREILDTIITKKATTRFGYMKLFAACLRQANVAHEIGWAWDRTESRFDPAFESLLGLDYAVIYFPKQKKFLSPLNTNLRYPVVNPEIAASKGIFCTIPRKGDVTAGLYKVRYITPLSFKETRHDITASISFDKSMNSTVNVSHEWYGYSAIGIRSKLPFVRPENMKEYANGILDFTSNPDNIITYNFSNEDPSNFNTNIPLTLYASVNGSSLIDKASNRYLIKLGDLLPDHANLYEEKKRVMPVDLLYPHSYNYNITINIPRGYKILNPEALQKNVDYYNSEMKRVINFNADYKLVRDYKNGDKMVITVNESYSQVHFPLFELERFRKVLNTAADFGNTTLVMARH